jgi:hypothetical protein
LEAGLSRRRYFADLLVSYFMNHSRVCQWPP